MTSEERKSKNQPAREKILSSTDDLFQRLTEMIASEGEPVEWSATRSFSVLVNGRPMIYHYEMKLSEA